jgi:hypothetical protein
MLAQPGREGLGSAIGQEVARLMLFKVDENRSIDPTFLKREVVNTKYRWGHGWC